MKKVVLAFTLLFMSLSTHAAVLDLSTGTDTITKGFDTAGFFEDTYTFSLSADSTLFVTAKSMLLQFGDALVTGIDGFSVDLYSGAGLLGSATGSSFALSFASVDTLSLGEYELRVSGDVVGSGNFLGTELVKGFYSMTAIAAPVPEASTLSLMLAGFGLIGFMSYRRRNLI